jgi:cytochrome c oxidase subunit 2
VLIGVPQVSCGGNLGSTPLVKRHPALLALLATGCAAASGGGAGAFTPAGEAARGPFTLTSLMIVLGAVVYALVGVVVLVALRRRGAAPSARGRADTHRFDRRMIIVGGILLPTPILLTLLVGNIYVLAGQTRGGPLRIEIEGRQYWWEIRYPAQGIIDANEVHIPTGERVELVLTSADVIHSWWVPELSGKRDLIPGRENVLVVEADRPGVYRGQCAEFCGIQHGNMAMFVVAQEPAEFAGWVRSHARLAVLRPATASLRRGQDVFMSNCAGCHTVAGTPADGRQGPDLTHFASRMTIGAGAVPNDRGNLGGWVANAQSIKPGNRMPPIPVPADGMNDLLDYVESLR